MKKKETITETALVVKTNKINPLSTSFSQEDLNKVVDKINEIIGHLNSVL